MQTVAALFVETDGCYYGLPGVDPWDQARDARLDELVGALLRANLAEPLDGEEFDDLSDEQRARLKETY